MSHLKNKFIKRRKDTRETKTSIKEKESWVERYKNKSVKNQTSWDHTEEKGRKSTRLQENTTDNVEIHRATQGSPRERCAHEGISRRASGTPRSAARLLFLRAPAVPRLRAALTLDGGTPRVALRPRSGPRSSPRWPRTDPRPVASDTESSLESLIWPLPVHFFPMSTGASNFKCPKHNSTGVSSGSVYSWSHL